MSGSARLALVLVVGVLIGFGLGILGDGQGELATDGLAQEESRGATEPPVAQDAPRSTGESLSRRDTPVEGPERVPESRRSAGEEELFSRPLLDHHARSFLAGWQEVRAEEPDELARAQGEREFRDAVLALSATLGRRAAEAAERRDALLASLASGDGLSLLALAKEGAWTPTLEELTSESERWFQRKTTGEQLHGSEFAAGDGKSLTPGVVLRFEAGIHVLDERKLRGSDGRTIPSDVTILGAGKDATLLRIGNISALGSVERLTFGDLTLDAQNDGLFDLRHEGASLQMERVRLVRFDAGHGGCSIFSSRGGVLIRAVDTDFIGGYGTAPGSGFLLRSDPCIARFTRCRFELVGFRHVREASSGSLMLFEHCKFELEGIDPRVSNPSLHFQACTYTQVPPGTPVQELQKNLGDLFFGG